MRNGFGIGAWFVFCGLSFLAPISRSSLAHPYALRLGAYIGGNTRKVRAVIVARAKIARVNIPAALIPAGDGDS